MDAQNDQKFRDFLEHDINGIRLTSCDQSMIRDKIEGVKPMKKQVSLSLVFVMAMMLLAGVALATALTMRDAGRRAFETEINEGVYENWAISDKITLVGTLTELGYIDKTADVQLLLAGSLHDKAAHKAADDAIMRFTDSPVSEVSFNIIMEAAWGAFDDWSHEQKAWFSQLRTEMGVQGIDHDLYLMPYGRIEEAQAVSIALAELAKGFGVSERLFAEYVIKTSFLVPEGMDGDQDDEAYWAVTVAPPAGYVSSESSPVIMMTVYVNPDTGELRDSVASRLEMRNSILPRRDDAINTTARELLEQADYEPLWNRTLEQKAEFTRKVKPLVDAMLKAGDLGAITYDGEIDYSLIAASTYRYGLPEVDDVSEELAVVLAAEALREFGLTEDTIVEYVPASIFFDVTDSEKPLWKITFNSITDSIKSQLGYHVHLDAHSGTLIEIEEFNYNPFKAYNWRTLEDALEPYM